MSGTYSSHTIPALEHEGNIVTNSRNIANIITHKLRDKIKNIQHPLIPPETQNQPIQQSADTQNNMYSINQPFTMQELHYSLKTCKNTAGPDNIPFIFSKNLSLQTQQALLNQFGPNKSSQLSRKSQ
ncbi:hypothetical protein HHI36_000101 [Cryptolaemus montrouzieri]|uniref:Uncharacterized protein n=1 Tax=Cryptolaemus montrouzieri TaxID=559131 RepID=A0ABD2P3L0_9CUCU